MTHRSLRFRLIAWYAGLLVALVVAFGIYTCQRLNHYLSLVLTQTLEHRANQIATTLIANIGKTGEAFVRAEIKALYAPELNDRFIRVTRLDGVVIYASDSPNDKSFNPKKMMPASLLNKSGIIEEENAGSHVKLLVSSVPVQVGKQRYVVEVGASEDDLERVLKGYALTLMIGLPIVGGVAIVGGYMLIERALSPVRKIIGAAQEITLHHLNKRLPVVKTGDEIEDLSRTLNQMIGRLEESFQSVSRFTSDASHELRTPLTIVRGELETLVLERDLRAPVRTALESLLEEAERLGKIVERLLALSRLDAGAGQMERSRFDLAELASTTVEQMCLLAVEKQIDVAFEIQERIEVEGDKARLKQVVVNLLDNAIKYTPRGGRIKVSVTRRDGCAVLGVVDSGGGIRSEALPHIFDRFYRAEDARSGKIDGAGLGLSIVKAICSAHGGTVVAVNLPGGGCQVSAEIPLAGKT